MKTDITYCGNARCPFHDCDRHIANAPICVPVKYAMLDGTCRRYIAWQLNELEEGREVN
jgi:hypothetical protein